MSVLKLKAEESIIASDMLFKASHYNSSVHCSYYSCVQLMLHLLRTHFGKTELVIKEEGILGGQNDNGYHNWLLNLIFKEFVRLNGIDAAKFNSIIFALKKERVKADYQNHHIKPKAAKIAYNKSESVHELIHKNFQL